MFSFPKVFCLLALSLFGLGSQQIKKKKSLVDSGVWGGFVKRLILPKPKYLNLKPKRFCNKFCPHMLFISLFHYSFIHYKGAHVSASGCIKQIVLLGNNSLKWEFAIEQVKYHLKPIDILVIVSPPDKYFDILAMTIIQCRFHF